MIALRLVCDDRSPNREQERVVRLGRARELNFNNAAQLFSEQQESGLLVAANLNRALIDILNE